VSQLNVLNALDHQLLQVVLDPLDGRLGIQLIEAAIIPRSHALIDPSAAMG
jgi:hypothetical protein